MLYYNNNDNDIKILKEGLTSKSNETITDVSAARQAINEQLGKVFEKNIRNILEKNHGFKRKSYSDKIFMKKIEIYNKGKKPDEYEVIQNNTISVLINNKNYEISYDAQHNVIIRDSEKKEIEKIHSIKSNIETELIIDNIKLKIFQYMEMEFDGYFTMNNFKINLFDNNEVDIIYSNISEKEENNFTNSIIEVKLSIICHGIVPPLEYSPQKFFKKLKNEFRLNYVPSPEKKALYIFYMYMNIVFLYF